MTTKPLSQLSDEELLQAAKHVKATAITNALFIGFLAGIVLYSVIQNTWGFLTLIPLFLIYKFVKSPNYDKQELERLLHERKLTHTH